MADPTAPVPYLDVPRPFVMAHRGFDLSGLENSMVAFQAAVDLGVSHVETDVHATVDGVLVAFHDDTLNRTTDSSGRIRDLTWAQVAKARIGGVEPVPRLDDLLGSFPRLRVNVDVKARPAIRPLVRVIRRHRAQDRVCVASFSDLRRLTVRWLLGKPVATSPGRIVTTGYWLAGQVPVLGQRLRRVAARGLTCLQLPPTAGPLRVDRSFVETAHELGLQVHVWTVNDPAQMRTLLDHGVDALITDRSDLAVDVLRDRAR